MADNGSYYKFTTPQCVVRVYKNPIRFAMYDKNNRAVIYEEAEPLAFGLKTTQTMRRSGDEDFYGCGMQQGNFSYAGKEADIEVTGWDEDMAYSAIRLPRAIMPSTARRCWTRTMMMALS